MVYYYELNLDHINDITSSVDYWSSIDLIKQFAKVESQCNC